MAWSTLGVRMIGVADSIEQPYMLQNQYLRSVPNVLFVETLDDPNVDIDFLNGNGIIHFPLWELPKVPERSIEAISAIQVLREVGPEFLDFLFNELSRILVKGGIFYVRDNDHEYKDTCMHNIQITQQLQKMGFEVEKYDLIQGEDIHGVPRVFRWIG